MRSVQKLALMVVFGLTALASVLIVYLADEDNRQETKAFQQKEAAIERGTASYLQFCMSCHGPRGQGFLYDEAWVGWPLAGEIVSDNDPNLRIYDDGLTPTQRNQSDDPVISAEREDVIRGVIERGRGLMPAWSEAEGGELNDEQIDELVLLIMEGDWDGVYNQAIEDNGGEYPMPPAPAGGSAAAADQGSSAPAEGGASSENAVRLEGGDIYFAPTELTVPIGGTIQLVNAGSSLHDFVIEGYNDDAPVDMPVGGEVVDWVVPDDLAPGTYTFYCSIPGHRAAGMEGTITITEASASTGEAEATPADGTAEATEGSPAAEEGQAPADGAATQGEVPVLEAQDIAWSVTELTAPVGGTIEMVNMGAAPHNFVVEGYAPLEESPLDLPVGGETIEWTVPDDLAPGEYTYYCSIPGHEQLMRGTLTVT